MNTNKEKEDFQKHLELIANDITNGIKSLKKILIITVNMKQEIR